MDEINSALRQEIINLSNCDIISVNETHLTDREEIYVTDFDYIWKGSNRKNIHIKAAKGSGGVGLFIKKWLFEFYNVTH